MVDCISFFPSIGASPCYRQPPVPSTCRTVCRQSSCSKQRTTCTSYSHNEHVHVSTFYRQSNGYSAGYPWLPACRHCRVSILSHVPGQRDHYYPKKAYWPALLPVISLLVGGHMLFRIYFSFLSYFGLFRVIVVYVGVLSYHTNLQVFVDFRIQITGLVTAQMSNSNCVQ